MSVYKTGNKLFISSLNPSIFVGKVCLTRTNLT